MRSRSQGNLRLGQIIRAKEGQSQMKLGGLGNENSKCVAKGT